MRTPGQMDKDKAAISYLDIELTERCNNNCIHCYINLPPESDVKLKELDTIEIMNILREAISLGCLTVKFTGGEPMLRNDFDDLYIFARRSGLIVKIITNATFIDSKKAALFAKYPCLTPIEISIYGMSQKSYNNITRNPEAFHSVMRAIKLLNFHSVPYLLRSVVLPPNKSEITSLMSLAKSSKSWKGMGTPLATNFFFRARRDSPEKNKEIAALRISPEERMSIYTEQGDDYKNRISRFCKANLKLHGDKLFSCDAGKNGICIDAYGYLQPCLLVRHPSVTYNLRNGSIQDALFKFLPRVLKMRAVSTEYLSKCARCFLKSLCELCPAKSWMEFGTLDKPVPYLCEIAHHKAKLVGLIAPEEHAWNIIDYRSRLKNLP